MYLFCWHVNSHEEWLDHHGEVVSGIIATGVDQVPDVLLGWRKEGVLLKEDQ